MNGLTFKKVKVAPDGFRWQCINPKEIPPDDLDDVILGKMAKDAEAMYQWELKKWKGRI